MSPEQKLSKRQMMREKRQRQARLQRLGMIGIIVVGALLVAAALIYPNLKPVGEVASADSVERPMVNDNAMGDPNAPIKIEEFSDYQCPFCARFYEETEWQIVRYLCRRWNGVFCLSLVRQFYRSRVKSCG
jgi:protein-disulfide isomerase